LTLAFFYLISTLYLIRLIDHPALTPTLVKHYADVLGRWHHTDADDVTLSNSSSTCSPLSPSITHSLFYSTLKTHLFHKSFPP